MGERALKPGFNPPGELHQSEILAKELKDDGVFPNSKFPLLIYRQVVSDQDPGPAATFEKLFAGNNWHGSWRNGIYSFHHYHSTAHEVLGIYRGSAQLQFGGEHGITLEVQFGDVIVIPAGVAHKSLRSSSDFGVVGAYPEGQEWDMNYGKAGERPKADRNIAQVPQPTKDPVYGAQGPLSKKWVMR